MSADLERRIEELEGVVLAFAAAYRLHKRENVPVSKLKARMVMNTSVEDWKRAYELMYGEDKVVEVVE